MADGGLEDGRLEFVVFLDDAAVDGVPETEKPCEDAGPLLVAVFELEAIEGCFVDFAHFL